MLVDIGNEDPEWGAVEEEMQSTIRFYIYTCVDKDEVLFLWNPEQLPIHNLGLKAFAAKSSLS